MIRSLEAFGNRWLLIQVDHAVTHWHAIQMEAVVGDHILIVSLSRV
jgi:hypothetical protein